ncbi:MAG: hypothetical protein COU33_00155, partial [Candidatus Magasanikbacteria bacterium CG10_big_fil_rev_8_21_14_0_10_43_6]
MNSNTILDNLSSHLKSVIASAISLATSQQHTNVTPTHMLLALLKEKGAVGAEILQKVALSEESITQELNTFDLRKDTTTETHIRTALLPELDAPAKKVLEKAMILAYEHEHKYVGTEHLLHGLIVIQDIHISRILKKNHITKKLVKDHIEVVLHSTTKFPDIEDVTEVMEEMEDIHGNESPHAPHAPSSPEKKKKNAQKRSSQALDAFATLISSKNMQASIDPVIGRAEEIDRLMHILCRRTKNNPVL